MRKLASVQVVKNLRPMENSDNLEVAEVLGWDCVVKKGELSVETLLEAPTSRNLTGADDEQGAQASLLRASKPYAREPLVVVQASDRLPLADPAQLHGKTLHAIQANSHE